VGGKHTRCSAGSKEKGGLEGNCFFHDPLLRVGVLERVSCDEGERIRIMGGRKKEEEFCIKEKGNPH